MKDDKTFATRLKICLNLRDKKAINLADNCGISRGLVSQYLNGTRFPKQAQIEKVAKYLDVSPLYLMLLQDNITNYSIKLHQSIGEPSEEEIQRQAIMNEINSLCSYATLDTLKVVKSLVSAVCNKKG